jgi:hypothetical protein
MATEVRDWVSFDDFARLVERSEYKVRQALAALRGIEHFIPQFAPADNRRIVYNPDWAPRVREWIDNGR